MVLAGDHDPAGVKVLHRMIGPVMAKFHLQGPAAARKTKQLVTEADSKRRHIGIQNGFDRANCIIARLRVTRAVRQKHPVGFQRQYFACRSLRRHDRDSAGATREHAQDIALHAVVVGDNVMFRRRRRRESLTERPFGLIPRIRFVATYDFREVHAGQTGKCARLLERKGLVYASTHQAAALRALVAQNAGQLARIDAGNRRDIVLAQILGQSLGHAEIARPNRQITNHQSGGEHLMRLRVFWIHADIADMRIGERDNLAAIRRVGQNFLITGHGSVEYHLSGRMGLRADRDSAKHRAISKRKNGGLTIEGRQEGLPGRCFKTGPHQSCIDSDLYMESGRGTHLPRFHLARDYRLSAASDQCAAVPQPDPTIGAAGAPYRTSLLVHHLPEAIRTTGLASSTHHPSRRQAAS